MRLSRLALPIPLLVLIVSTDALFAQIGSPVPNWTVPPYRVSTDAGGLRPQVDATGPAIFVAVVPCRVVDTRGPVGPYGGPALATNTPRSFNIEVGPCTGIAPLAAAYSLNFGAILPPADGFLTAWPTGTSQPTVSQLNMLGGEVVANAAVVPAGSGSISVLVNIGPTHVYIDINGYFASELLNPGQSFFVWGDVANCLLCVKNNNAVTGSTFVNAISAIMGSNQNNVSVIRAENQGISGANTAVTAIVDSTMNNAAAIRAYEGGGAVPFTVSATSAAVRGESAGGGTGVLGLVSDPNGEGVTGQFLSEAGAFQSAGHLGYSANIGIYFENGLSGSGMKTFIEPHPTDPTKVIRYVSLEGNEAGTYFRGRGRFQRGLAHIPVPADFRMVTAPEGLTVQVTPIGAMASVGVIRLGLDEIVVQCSRDVEFSYMVNGVRRAYPRIEPIAENAKFFVPASPNARLPEYLSEDERRRLISNGTYRPDGTVNLETARRVGWDRLWERTRLTPEAAPK